MRQLSTTLLCAAALCLLSCGGDPEPVEGDDENVEQVESKPGNKPARSGSHKPGPATNIGMDRFKRFPRQVMELKIGDLIEARLKHGGVAEGKIRTLRPRMMTIYKGSSVITLKPETVVDVRLVSRPESPLDIDLDSPRNAQERWLERYLNREILSSKPADLWKGRFARNVALVVRRDFKMTGLRLIRRTSKAYFKEIPEPVVFQQFDRIKLVGVVLGYNLKPTGQETCLGETYLYLVLRDRTVRFVPSIERLHPGDLDRKSVKHFLNSERVTLVVTRPRSRKYVKIARVLARDARIYRQHLERSPDRPAIRRYRAKQDSRLAGAERRIRSIYAAVGLKGEEHLDLPLKLSFRVPSDEEGGIHLLPYSKEIGLD